MSGGGGEGASVRTVLMTAPDAASARSLVRALVEDGLAACGNILPAVHSIYRWRGAVEEAEEVLVILKTRADRVEELLRRTSEAHPYDVPELLVSVVESGYGPYLEWVRRECAPGDG